MYSFLETNNILFSSQYGFRTKRSCEQAIMEVVGYALQAKNKREECACLYLDLSKAFDTLDHSILLKKLNNYGIRGTANMWFENYLSNRSLIAKVTTSPTKWLNPGDLTLPMERPKAAALVRYCLYYLSMIYIIYQYIAN